MDQLGIIFKKNFLKIFFYVLGFLKILNLVKKKLAKNFQLIFKKLLIDLTFKKQNFNFKLIENRKVNDSLWIKK